MEKTKILLTARFSQKFILVKGIVQVVALLIFLGIFGCAGMTGMTVVDTVPQGEPKGFVRFYIMEKQLKENFPGLPDIYCNGVSQGSWPIFNPVWHHNDRRSIMISRTPGIHRFSIQLNRVRENMRVRTVSKDIQVRIEEGKITPVRISFTHVEEDIGLSLDVSKTTFFFTMHVTVEETVPLMK
jgi:hypothetical protein